MQVTLGIYRVVSEGRALVNVQCKAEFFERRHRGDTVRVVHFSFDYCTCLFMNVVDSIRATSHLYHLGSA